ncbi:MAG: isoprenylcysteine carboxylmethyltransferase family protein [Rhodospirillales bacterium]|nr:isoprenylcysteine carboxylmethyltransferase family protein [Rhodospirillales bacterium]
MAGAPPNPPVSGPRLFPLALLLVCMGVMVILDRLLPIAVILSPPLTFLGWLPVVAGVAVVIAARFNFKRAETTVMPFAEASALVTDGMFAHSRNPMYTAFVAILAGTFILLGTLSPVVVIPLFVWLIRAAVIAGEEKRLEKTFGAAYRDYKSRVRRWL